MLPQSGAPAQKRLYACLTTIQGPDCVESTRVPLRTDSTPDGVDLIAEPWAVGNGTYQLGRFPDGWSEWNDVYRKTLRRAENKLHVRSVLPWEVANVLAGSYQQVRPAGATRATPRPWNSINYLASHDLLGSDHFGYSSPLTHRGLSISPRRAAHEL